MIEAVPIDDVPVIEEIEPVYWNAGVSARLEPGGDVVVSASEPDPMALTPHPYIPSI